MDHLALAVRVGAGVSGRQTVGADRVRCYARGMNIGIARASESAWRTTISDKTG